MTLVNSLGDRRMESGAYVQLALKMLSCSQKELAMRLGVSQGQITKWKQNEHMSGDMRQKFESLLNIGDKDPEFVLSAGSLGNADKWEKLVYFLADHAKDLAETGYDAYMLHDAKENFLCHSTFRVLRTMGVVLPKTFPKELDVDYDDEETEQDVFGLIRENPYSGLILSIYESLNDVYGFYAAFVRELVDDEKLELSDEVESSEMEDCLIDLAASKLEVEKALAPDFGDFKYKVLRQYEKWLMSIKNAAFRAGVPLRAELLSMIHQSTEELSLQAEKEGMGFNSSRVHPDIYMNELLCGMRIIHQVLPAIMEKLGIKDTFELDQSELYIS